MKRERPTENYPVRSATRPNRTSFRNLVQLAFNITTVEVCKMTQNNKLQGISSSNHFDSDAQIPVQSITTKIKAKKLKLLHKLKILGYSIIRERKRKVSSLSPHRQNTNFTQQNNRKRNTKGKSRPNKLTRSGLH